MPKVIFLFFLLCAVALGQPRDSIVFDMDYERLPLNIRIDNSGIYAVDGFSCADSGLYLLQHDSRRLWRAEGKSNLKPTAKTVEFNAVSGINDGYMIYRNAPMMGPSYFKNGRINYAKPGADGSYLLDDNRSVNVIRESASGLKILISQADSSHSASLALPGDLACAEFIGMDAAGSLFILVERMSSGRQLKVNRYVYMFNAKGGFIGAFGVPLQKYLAVAKEFEVTANGSVTQMLSDEKKLRIIQWQTRGIQAGKTYECPVEYSRSLHYNEFVPKTDPAIKPDKSLPLTAVDRASCLRIAETYVMHRYTCSAANLAAAKIKTPDGDSLQTPPRLSVGVNSEIPYKWGGFNTLSGFDNGIASGKYAGDIDCESSSTYAVGVDCSGFVSRCWQLSSHYVTADMPTICTELTAWDSLRPADAILRDGHVRMFVERTTSGSFRVVESSGRDWGVSYWTYTASDLSIYAPYRYNNMSTSYNLKIPVLARVTITDQNKVATAWTCDTAGIIGYRLYKSTDGAAWTLLYNESTLKSQSIEFQLTDSAACYRVSSVKTESAVTTEGYWSNVLCYTNYYSPKRYLIVHGFTRTGGAWRSTTDDFITSDFKAMKAWKRKCESVRNSEILSGIDAAKYDAVFWILGDESTANATFSTSEQPIVKSYLEAGGSLFVSGSEIGYDLYSQGSTTDKSFYNNYLKAQYVSDDAASTGAAGVTGKALDGCNMTFGQTFDVSTPDAIDTYGGSEACIKYTNNKTAGIQFTGKFGTSAKTGRLIHLAFPLESCANDSAIQMVLGRSIKYLSNGGNLSLKFIPGGFYDSSKNSLRLKDTFKIYLASVISPYLIVDSAVVVQDSITFTARALFRNAAAGSYYIVIKHRNSLETWSRSGGEVYSADALQGYDFTDAAAKAYGNNLSLKNSKYCLYSGDVNSDGKIDYADIKTVCDDAAQYKKGWLVSDINGDGQVDFSDEIIDDNNAGLLITVKKPGK